MQFHPKALLTLALFGVLAMMIGATGLGLLVHLALVGWALVVGVQTAARVAAHRNGPVQRQ
jgi:hypothetical protein